MAGPGGLRFGDSPDLALAERDAADRRQACILDRSRPGIGAQGLGLALHAAAFAASVAATHRLPVTDVRSALSFFAFLVTVAFFFAYVRYRIAALGIFMLPLVFVLTLVSALRPEDSFRSPAFRGGWLLVHIATIFLGYTGFFLTFVAAVMYLIQERDLKSKRPRALHYRLPSLDVCDELYYRSLVFGLPFLSVGILTGFVWAARRGRAPGSSTRKSWPRSSLG